MIIRSYIMRRTFCGAGAAVLTAWSRLYRDAWSVIRTAPFISRTA